MPINYSIESFDVVSYNKIKIYDQANPIPHPPSNILLAPWVIWSPPPSSVFKVNFDDAIFRGSSEASIRVVIRNHLGLVLASMS